MVYAIFSVLIALCGEDIYRKIMFPGLLFTMIMVIGLSPVLHSRKHLTQKEILVFRRFAITICAAEIAVIVIAFCIFGCNVYVFSLVCGQLAVSLSMGAACIKKYIKERGVKK